MITLKAHYDGKVFIPEQEVNLPAGSELELTITPRNGAPTSSQHHATTTLADLAKIAADFPDDASLPTDLAEQHDHYLYGTPKR